MELVLDDNGFEGPVPADQLAALRSLQVLSLERNRLSGPLPPRLGDLGASLRVLRLGANRLHGPVPPEWSALRGPPGGAGGLVELVSPRYIIPPMCAGAPLSIFLTGGEVR